MSAAPPTLYDLLAAHLPELVYQSKVERIRQKEVAKILECSRQQVYNISAGKCRIGYKSAKNLVAYSNGRLTLDHLDPLISNNRA